MTSNVYSKNCLMDYLSLTILQMEILQLHIAHIFNATVIFPLFMIQDDLKMTIRGWNMLPY